MKDYLAFLNEKFPIRRSKEQKEEFIKYVKEEISGYNVDVETLEKEHNNILIGDVENAKVVFTAHYDTPATSIVPNLMLPKNKVLGLIISSFFISLITFFFIFFNSLSFITFNTYLGSCQSISSCIIFLIKGIFFKNSFITIPPLQ